MTLQEYRQTCERTKMDLPEDEWQEYLRIGVLGELGELLNLFKKYRWHGHEFERERVIDELGDVLWHVVQMEGSAARLMLCGYDLGKGSLDSESDTTRNVRNQCAPVSVAAGV